MVYTESYRVNFGSDLIELQLYTKFKLNFIKLKECSSYGPGLSFATIEAGGNAGEMWVNCAWLTGFKHISK